MIKYLRSPDGTKQIGHDVSTPSGKRSREICIANGYTPIKGDDETDGRDSGQTAKTAVDKDRAARLKSVVASLSKLKVEFDAATPLEELEALLADKKAEAEAEKAKTAVDKDAKPPQK